MTDDRELKAVRISDILTMVAAASVGAFAIHWLLSHPDSARTIRMRIALTVQKGALGVSDSARYVADRAGTEYNRMRLSV